MAEFIRIGRLVLNMEHICAIARSQNGEEAVVFISGKGPRDMGHFTISGPDAEKLWKYVTENKCTNISSD